ncbi:Hypothetical_protein [Hexamita inflata]|uniref:Hypothetical_protein n=1 Tax=Hexamita inflata TaxID=28002 RepID=A0AA86NHX4_9EUKA|nr:Hypothetical protein HINF_LOCUS7932 [Hexamita inflata]
MLFVYSLFCGPNQFQQNDSCVCVDSKMTLSNNFCVCSSNYFQIGQNCLECNGGNLYKNYCECPDNSLYDIGSQRCKTITSNDNKQNEDNQNKNQNDEQMNKVLNKIDKLEVKMDQVVQAVNGIIQMAGQQNGQPQQPQIPAETEITDDMSVNEDTLLTCESIIAARGMKVQYCQKAENLYKLKLKDDIKFSETVNYIFLKAPKIANVQVESNVLNEAVFAVFGFSQEKLTVQNITLNVSLVANAMSAALLCDVCDAMVKDSTLIFIAKSEECGGLVLNGQTSLEVFDTFVQIRLFGTRVGGIIGNIKAPLTSFELVRVRLNGFLRQFYQVEPVIGVVVSETVDQVVWFRGVSLCLLGKFELAGRGALQQQVSDPVEQRTCQAMCEEVGQFFLFGICAPKEDKEFQLFEIPAPKFANSTESCESQIAARGFNITFCKKQEYVYNLELQKDLKFNAHSSYIFSKTQKIANVVVKSNVNKGVTFAVFGFSHYKLELKEVNIKIKLEVMAQHAALLCERCAIRADSADFSFDAKAVNVAGLAMNAEQIIILNNSFLQLRLFGENAAGVACFVKKELVQFQLNFVNITGFLRPFYDAQNGSIGFVTAECVDQQKIIFKEASVCIAGKFELSGKGQLVPQMDGQWEQLSCEVMCSRDGKKFLYGLCENQDVEISLVEQIKPTGFETASIVVEDEIKDQMDADSLGKVTCESIIAARGMKVQYCQKAENLYKLKLKDDIKFSETVNYIFLKAPKIANVQVESNVLNEAVFAVFGFSQEKLTVQNITLNVSLVANAMSAALLCDVCDAMVKDSTLIFIAKSEECGGLVLNGQTSLEVFDTFVQIRLFGTRVGGIIGNIKAPLTSFELVRVRLNGFLRQFYQVEPVIGVVVSETVDQVVWFRGVSLCLLGKFELAGRGALQQQVSDPVEQRTCQAMCEEVGQFFLFGICAPKEDKEFQLFEIPAPKFANSTESCESQIAARGFNITFCKKQEYVYNLELQKDLKFNAHSSYIFSKTQKIANVVVKSNVNKGVTFAVFGFSHYKLELKEVNIKIKLEVMAQHAALLCERCAIRADSADFSFDAKAVNVAGLAMNAEQLIILNNSFLQLRLFGENAAGVACFVKKELVQFQLNFVNITGFLRPFYDAQNGSIGFVTAECVDQQKIIFKEASVCIAGKFELSGKGQLVPQMDGQWEQLSCEVMCSRDGKKFLYGLCENQDVEISLVEQIKPTGFETASIVVEDEIKDQMDADSLGKVTCESIIAARGMKVQYCQKAENLYKLKLKDDIKFSETVNYIFLKAPKIANVQVESNVLNEAVFAVFGFSQEKLTVQNITLNVSLVANAMSAALLCDVCDAMVKDSTLIFIAKSEECGGLVLNGQTSLEVFDTFVQIRLFGTRVGGIIGNIKAPLTSFELVRVRLNGFLRQFYQVEPVIGVVVSETVDQVVWFRGVSLCLLGKFELAGRGALQQQVSDPVEQRTCQAMCEEVGQFFLFGICAPKEDKEFQLFEIPAPKFANSTESCESQIAARGFNITFCKKQEYVYNLELQKDLKFNAHSSYIFSKTQKIANVVVKSNVNKGVTFAVFGFSHYKLELKEVNIKIKLEVMAQHAALLCERCAIRADSADFSFDAKAVNVAGLAMNAEQIIILNNSFLQLRLFGENAAGVACFVKKELIQFQLNFVNITGFLRPFIDAQNGSIGFITSECFNQQSIIFKQSSLCIAGKFNLSGKNTLVPIMDGKWEQLSCEQMCAKNGKKFLFGLCEDQKEEIKLTEVTKPVVNEKPKQKKKKTANKQETKSEQQVNQQVNQSQDKQVNQQANKQQEANQQPKVNITNQKPKENKQEVKQEPIQTKQQQEQNVKKEQEIPEKKYENVKGKKLSLKKQ